MKKFPLWRELVEPGVTLAPEVKEALNRQQSERICQSKRRYLSESAALSTADQFAKSRRFKKGSKESRAYKCPTCGFFHITTKART